MESILHNKNGLWGVGWFYLNVVEGILISQYVRKLWSYPGGIAEEKRGNKSNEGLLEYLEDKIFAIYSW